jgi:NADPH-dependent curcumin reductase CurA
MPGFTAYLFVVKKFALMCSGLKDIGHPKKGETIFISGAAGAVGQVVAQLAKNEGSSSSHILLTDRTTCCWERWR